MAQRPHAAGARRMQCYRQLGGAQVAGEQGAVAAQLGEGGLLDLADALLGDAVGRAEVAQGHAPPVRAVQPVAHADHLRSRQVGPASGQASFPLNGARF